MQAQLRQSVNTETGNHLRLQRRVISKSFDTRNRSAGSLLSSFDIDLGSQQKIRQVAGIHLGSIELPNSRYSVPNTVPTGSVFSYSEPITIAAGTVITLQETLDVVSKITGETTTSTTFPQVQIIIPPTMNALQTAVLNGANEDFTTTSNHGLQFVQFHYPGLGLNASIVGALYPAPAAGNANFFGPQVRDNALNVNGTTGFSLTIAYLNQLIVDANPSLRFVSAGVYNSFLYVEPPTLSELMLMLNAEFRRINNPQNFAPVGTTTISLVSLAYDEPNNQLRFLGESAQRVNETATTFSIVRMNLLGAAFLGFTPGLMPRNAPLQTVPPIRIFRAPHGIFDAVTLGTQLSLFWSPLVLQGLPSLTFVLRVPGGVAFNITLIQGRYQGAQLAAHIQERIRTATADQNFFVTFALTVVDSSLNIAEGRFTFSHQEGLQFSLDFTGTAATLGSLLGFEGGNVYAQSHRYVSPLAAVRGQGTTQTFPTNSFTIVFNTIRQHYQLMTTASTSFFADSQAAALQWNTEQSGGGAALVPDAYRTNDVLWVRVLGPAPPAGLVVGDVLTIVVQTPWNGTTNAPIPFVTLFGTASILHPNGIGTVAAGNTVEARAARRGVWQPHMSFPTAIARQLGFSRQTFPIQTALMQISGELINPTEAPFQIQGDARTIIPYLYESPYVVDLTPLPSGIYIVIRSIPTDTGANTHQRVDFQHTPILAKLYHNARFLHINEERNANFLTHPMDLQRFRIEFQLSDGTLAQFNGVDFTFTLLFSVYEQTLQHHLSEL